VRKVTKALLGLALASAGFAVAAAAFAGSPGTAAKQLRVGVADDAAKFAADGGAAEFAQMSGLGLSSLRVSVFYNPRDPEALQGGAGAERILHEAAGTGVQLVFALYGDPSVVGQAKSLSTRPGADAFCRWAASVARAFPRVTRFIVGNEPNQPRFWQPQFNKVGRQLSGWQYAYVLATCYDALKAVNPAIDVIGVGLSPRGNDLPRAISNSSTSPVRFLQAMGAAYRASGRTRPLMDELSVHCYPNANTDPLLRGYAWPNIGCVNLVRLKQAVWDAFNGTAQPTFAEAPQPLGATTSAPTATAPVSTAAAATSTAAGCTLPATTDTGTDTGTGTDQTTTDTTTGATATDATVTGETATTTTAQADQTTADDSQVTETTGGCAANAGPRPLTLVVDETGWQVRVAGTQYVGRENVRVITEAKQASIYGALVQRLVCDPSITALHFLYFEDSTRLQDFQSGLLRADGTVRPAAAAVRAALAAGCTGAPVNWHHLTTVAAPRVSYSRRLGWRLHVGEGVAYRAAEYRVSGPAAARAAAARALQKGYAKVSDAAPAAVHAGTYLRGTISLGLPRLRSARGSVVVVELRALTNPARTAVVVWPPLLSR
jgi:hypothetical protein